MYYDRVQLKEGAKRRIKQDGVPSIKKVTLIYLILVSLIPTVLQCIYGGPMAEMQTAAMQAYYNLDFDAVMDIMAGSILGTAGMISLCCSILIGLYTAVVAIGYYYYTMKVARNQRTEYQDLTYGLNFVLKIILTAVLMAVYIFLWSCLFVIPGLIASYRYRMAYYALIDDPSISPSEAIRRSKLLMNGRKMNLFVLDLSFIGWSILANLCAMVGQEIGLWVCGTGLVGQIVASILSFAAFLPLGVWLNAYMQLSEVYFYEFARNDLAAQYQGGGPGGYQPPYQGRDDWQNQPGGQNPDNRWNQNPGQWNQDPPQDDGWNDDPWN